jgi:AraC family transcriptional regulator of adaptative response/methylated-DNA-[protein]-cysteine methyltransferase
MAGRAPQDGEWQRLVGRRPGPGFYGVTSTAILCRTGCPSRPPLRRNTRWFDRAEDGLAAGFRACLRCRPDPAG